MKFGSNEALVSGKVTCQMTKVVQLCCLDSRGSKCTRCSSGVTLPSSGTLDFLFQDGHDEVVLRHEVILHHETSEAVTQESLVLWERDDSFDKMFLSDAVLIVLFSKLSKDASY